MKNHAQNDRGQPYGRNDELKGPLSSWRQTHPYGVGCHYFQYSDQFALGRFDGENYNIGFYDICLQPYEDLIDEVRTGAGEIYDIAAGLKGPQVGEVKETNVVAY